MTPNSTKNQFFKGNTRSLSQIFLTSMTILIALSVLLALSSCGKKKTADDIIDLLPITSEDIVFGNEDAPITIVEFSDLECPACAFFHTIINQTWRLINQDVRLVIRHFPLTQIHAHAYMAASYLEAARKQGDVKEFLDAIYAGQSDWTGSADAEKIIQGYAVQLGFDIEKLIKDKNLAEIGDKIRKDMDEGVDIGVSGTPTVYLNGRKINFPNNPQDFYNFIQEELKKISAEN